MAEMDNSASGQLTENGDVSSNSMKSSPEIVSKTVNTKSVPKVKKAKFANVLNGYRSATYNFTLAGLKKSAINDPTSYRTSAVDLVIARSGGKGTAGISSNVEGVSREVIDQVIPSEEGDQVIKKTVQDFSGSTLVESFNKNSPGRFDLFIENVEVESIMGFSPQSGVSLPTSIKFEIVEPYSINGFIEALHVAAVAAGYPSYATASFLLKMDFVGYPDGDKITSAKIIDQTTRYFVFGFTGIEVEVTEKGTRYRCTAVPFNERAFGQPNVLKKPINMTGSTVKSILENLIKNVNEQIKNADTDSRTANNATNHDKYEIKFVDWNDATGFDYSKNTNKIAESDVLELLKDNALYKFPDPGTTTQPNATKADGVAQPSDLESVAYSPASKETDPTVQFTEGANIHECISSLIRDSKYTRDMLKTIGKEGNPDEFGMVDYFLVKLEVTNQDVPTDPVARKPFQTYTYVVSPYKIHYTRIPNYAAQKIDESKLSSLSVREYNYIYTGKNTDVLNFKLNFNTLFFEAIPVAMGNNDLPGAKYGAGNNNSVDVKSKGDNMSQVQENENPTATRMADPQPTKVQQTGGNAGQILDDPYSALAKNMHEAIVNSKASMISGQLEILGDPFFVVTGGIGNYNPTPSSRGVTSDGEAAHNYGEVLITVNFRNPIDINELAKGGRMYFDSQKVPFSGVYRVNKVVSTFRDGVFKQQLEILRVPGQVLDSKTPASDPATIFETETDPLSIVITDVSIAEKPSNRASTLNLLTQLGRGLPSTGLPGQLSNFTAATGGLGGSAKNLLTQVSGAVTNGLGKLASAASVFGGSIPGGTDQSATGIRMQASGIINSVRANLDSAATLKEAANTVQGAFPVSNAAEQMATDIVNKANAAANLVSVPGSGIGAGATVSITEGSSTKPTLAQGTVVATDLQSQTADLPTSIKNFAGTAKDLSFKALAAVGNSGIPSAFTVGGNLARGIANKISLLNSDTKSDPSALAAKFGINASQLSGLSPELQSKVLEQTASLAKRLPEDVDLAAAASKGLALDYIPAAKLANIPATAPAATAPEPEADKAAAPVAEVTNPLAGSGNKLNATDILAKSGKLISAASQVAGVSGSVKSVEAAFSAVKSVAGTAINNGNDLSTSVVAKFGSLSKGNSPLDKVMSNQQDSTG